MSLELSYKLMVHGKIHRKCVKGIWRKIAQSDAFALCKRMVGIHRADYLILHDYDLAQIVGQHRMHTYRYVHHTVQNHALKLSCTVFVNFHGNIGEVLTESHYDFGKVKGSYNRGDAKYDSAAFHGL